MSTVPINGSSAAPQESGACLGLGQGGLRRLCRAVASGVITLSLLVTCPAAASEARSSSLDALDAIDYHLPENAAGVLVAAAEAPLEREDIAEIPPTAPAGSPLGPALPAIAWMAPRFGYGPQEPESGQQPPETPLNASQRLRYRSFGSQVGAVKWELGAVAAYYTATNAHKLFESPTAPHFFTEGWFGKRTDNLGVDKLAHAYSGYVVSELFYGRLKYKTDNAPGIQFTAAALATGIMLYSEAWDSIEREKGASWEDMVVHSMGAGFSILRNSVPDLDKKLDFRLMVVPNSNIVTIRGQRHFEQQRYFFALKLSGFEPFKNGPLRFLELHGGYYARNFTKADRDAGIPIKRRIFFGVGINLRELFFKSSTGWVGRAAGEVLDYFQPPYTALHRHVTN